MTEISPAARIIAKFGGQTRLAAALGRKQSTISYWAHTGLIPTRRVQEVMEAAQRVGVDLAHSDFFAPSPKRSRRLKTAHAAAE